MPAPSSNKKVDKKNAAYRYRGLSTKDRKNVGVRESYPLGSMSEGNDGSKSAKYPPKSKKKKPGDMPNGNTY